MTVYVYKKDGTKVPYVASTVDSIGFVNVHTITFNANGGSGNMNVIKIREGKTITLPTNTFTNSTSFTSWNTKVDGTGTTYPNEASVIVSKNLTLYAQWEGFASGHEWVDLGLPSGIKWATCNVGANSPEEYGDYFAWGETESKSSYSWSNYRWCFSGNSRRLEKYTVSPDNASVLDNKMVLEFSDDAARVNWGGKWRMPTKKEIEELFSNCNVERIIQNGVFGLRFISKINGNKIFLPAAGFHNDYALKSVGTWGYYWSSSLNAYDNSAYYLYFHSDNINYGNINRCTGRSVRPVLSK
jgi:hypothetical protein